MLHKRVEIVDLNSPALGRTGRITDTKHRDGKPTEYRVTFDDTDKHRFWWFQWHQLKETYDPLKT